MIEIDHTLLSTGALENLLIEIITRQSTDYGEHEVEIKIKKKQLMNKLDSGEVLIIYSSKEECCDIIEKAQFLKDIKNYT